MEDASIREATTEDAESVRQVARESWHAAYDEILGVEAVERIVEEWYAVDGLTESILRDDGRFLVAETDEDDPTDRESGKVVGFAQAVLGDDGDPAWLPRIYVRPDRWGSGLGTRLLDRVESWLREEGAERLRLAVIADNEVGNAFYERHGYVVVGERDEEVFGVAFEEYVRERRL